jgi:CDGSH-type Zn-finger protein
MAADPSITVAPNGPYLVSGVPVVARLPVSDGEGNVTWETSPPLRTEGRSALCRCGQSARKPICDGTHARIGFDGTETVGAGEEGCGAIDTALIEPDATPLPGDPGRAGERSDAGDASWCGLPVEVAVVADGPLHVTGGIRVTRSDGVVLEPRSRVALCRCGHSAHKPLCDGSHRTVGFTHTPDVGSDAVPNR